MIGNALDLAGRLNQSQIQAAAQSGAVALIRYLSNNPDKNLTLDEAKWASQAGMKLVVVWEARGDVYETFTAVQGLTDAGRAVSQAQALGMPSIGRIYWAVDFDANDDQIASGILAYAKAFAGVIRNSGYSVGVYGNGAVCAAMLDAKLVDGAWVWGAMGTNGTKDFVASNRWVIRQFNTTEEFGASVDPDQVQGDFGGWNPYVSIVTPPPPADPPKPDPFPAVVKLLQSSLQTMGLYTGPIDGDPGQETQNALRAYRRRRFGV